MSKDPLEELFGPSDDDTVPQPVAEPVPARQRLAQEQAERVRTAQLPTEKRAPKPAREKRGGGSSAKPWIVVGLVAVLAIVASIVTVNLVRGGSEAPDEAGPVPTTTTREPTTEQPSTSPSDEDADADGDEPDDPDAPPQVDVGPTSTMRIDAWGASSELSQRFGSTSYVIPDNVNLVLTSDLLNSFPDSCAAMRQEWGATRAENGSYSVLRPATTCADAPELYDEVWGLVDAWVKTIK